jgi:hypothetical protein
LKNEKTENSNQKRHDKEATALAKAFQGNPNHPITTETHKNAFIALITTESPKKNDSSPRGG